MGRRFSSLSIFGFAMALAVGAATRGVAADTPATAKPDDTARPTAAPANERPVELPPPTAADVPAELPVDFGAVRPMPGAVAPGGNLGPEAPTAGPRADSSATAPAGTPDRPSLSGALGKLWAKGKEQAGKPAGAARERDAAVTQTQGVPGSSARMPAMPRPVERPAAAPAGVVEPPPALPADPAAAPALPPPADALPAPRDPGVDPAQAPAPAPAPAQAAGAAPVAQPAAPPVTEANPLPPATAPPGGGGGALPNATPTIPAEPKVPFVLGAEETPMGRQSVGLTVDVVAPQVLNLNQAANIKIVVRNNGQSDARGVIVRDQLPSGLTFVSSTPAAERSESLLVWNLGTVPAGSEKVIALVGRPTRTGSCDHAATVTMMAASKARTIVREPKLKVEQSVQAGPILKGQPVSFKIAITNTGDGPARNITVQAKLTPGLRHETGDANDQNLLEMGVDLLNPGDHVVLDTLVVDAVLGGDQSCTVAVSSPDVVAGAPEARSVQTVNVVEPRLKMTLTGPDTRYTDMVSTYEITLENPGTAPAQNIRVQATIPVSARLLGPLAAGAQFNKETRRLSWVRPTLQPGGKDVLKFEVRTGGVGQYQFGAEARADRVELAKDLKLTDVVGLADVEVNVSERRRVVDLNGETVYVIKVTNIGSKEATKLSIRALLSPNLEPGLTSGTEAEASHDPSRNMVIFPLIDRLSPGKSIELGIRVKVKAAEPKLATCRVFVLHDDLNQKDEIEDVAAFKVTTSRR